RQVLAFVTEIGTAQTADEGPGSSTEGGNLPDLAFSVRFLRGREINQRRRIGRPTRRLMVSFVMRHLERRSPSEQTHPHLSSSANVGCERHRFPIRRQSRKFLHSDKVGQPHQMSWRRVLRTRPLK